MGQEGEMTAPYQIFQNMTQEQIMIYLNRYGSTVGYRVQNHMYSFGQGIAWSVEDAIAQVAHVLIASLIAPENRVSLTRYDMPTITSNQAIPQDYIKYGHELIIKIRNIDEDKTLQSQGLPDFAWVVEFSGHEIASNIAWGRSEAIAQAGLAIYKAFTVPSDREMWAKIEEGNK